MSITVKDILRLDILKTAELAAGKDGLAREVLRVNFTDSPLDPDEPGYHLVARGDLYIHSFYTDGTNEEQILKIIRFYIETGSSCCLAVKYHIQKLPDSVLRLAGQNRYPIIMIDANTSYGQLIKDISELILTEQLDLHSENKINRLLYDTLSGRECNEIIQYLVPNLPAHYQCAFLTCPSLSAMRLKLLKQEISAQFSIPFLRYQKGGFLIVDAARLPVGTFLSDSILPLIRRYEKHGSIGVSSHCSGAKDFISSFKEACSAHEISRITGAAVTCHDDVSIYNLLIPLKNHEVLQRFCRETLDPLTDYGRKHGIDLLETVRIYLNTNGTIRETATALNTHENTVRFRISKAKALLGLENDSYVFIERVALALKAKQLL